MRGEPEVSSVPQISEESVSKRRTCYHRVKGAEDRELSTGLATGKSPMTRQEQCREIGWVGREA